jgi:hypothetical protein
MLGLRLSQWLDVIRLAALIGGGLWALFIYRTSRRGEVKLAIEHRTRLLRDFLPDRSLLVVGIRLSNTSDVLWRCEDAVATLFDARKLSASGDVRLVPFSEADPFLPVYGSIAEDPADISAGDTFWYYEGQEISLEPGEQVESEVAFPLDNDKLGLMAMKVWFSGRQRNRSNRPYEWATFFYVEPEPSPVGSAP